MRSIFTSCPFCFILVLVARVNYGGDFSGYNTVQRIIIHFNFYSKNKTALEKKAFA